jgi:phosphoribosylaminoimidazolecarboxamide formyltransferase / IMP cyclohydrolase
MKRYAILSVTDKTGIVSFAKGLVELGFTVLSTGGTARALKEASVPYTYISDFTGQEEILGGRVKTLHPKVHAGILSRRNNQEDIREMEAGGFSNIDVVAVNLYPFIQVRKEKGDSLTPEEMVEYIDIGGPTMLRASAKNYHSVYSVIDPEDYSAVLASLRQSQDDADALAFRSSLAAKVFVHISAYDLAITEYLSRPSKSSDTTGTDMPLYTGCVLTQAQPLRYGENPHQSASCYTPLHGSGLTFMKQLQGKELSYNNLNDFSAAVSLGLDVSMHNSGKKSCVIIKHANPCGIAYGASVTESFRGALSCDPVSAFGGVIFFSHALDEETANSIVEAFYEVVIAPEVSEAARTVLASKKNLRVIEADYAAMRQAIESETMFKSISGAFLLQSPDTATVSMDEVEWVSGSEFSGTEKSDAALAWITVKHVTSNAITIASDGKVIGIGAGQMNRVDSSRIAVERAHRFGFSTKETVVASDAFFPFPDSIEVFRDAGVGLIIQPGGSLRDKEVFEAAKDFGIKMILTGKRHFKH